jgi:hypothetical protein
MLYGSSIMLRPVREADLDELYTAHAAGRGQDLLIYSLLRDDPRPWRP